MNSLLLDTTDARPVHFIGIAGAGMSALAELLKRRGVIVAGTDANPLGAPDLIAMGIAVSAHDPGLVRSARAVVYSSAIPATHPEMVAARELGLPLIRRAEALAAAVSGGTLVAIAGTHGKTTTTVMTTEALAAAGRDPTGVVGGRVGVWGGNLRLGTLDTDRATYVVEADEYDRSFLALSPTIAVVLNVEADHLDIYADLNDIRRTFETFLAPARVVVRCAADTGATGLRVTPSAQDVSYRIEPDARVKNARLIARHLVLSAEGSRFTVEYHGDTLGEVQLQVPGTHNVLNALAAIGVGLALGCSVRDMAPGLAAFRGVERRFQRLGAAAGVDVVDDYAHHPTEVAATLVAARQAFPSRRVLVAFQPHLYSRTRDLQFEFAGALALADGVVLCDIYGAREAPMAGVTSALIADRLPPELVRWTGPREGAASALRQIVQSGDVVLTMGAGDITRTGPELLDMLRS